MAGRRAPSATAWLAYRLGLAHRIAAEWVRLANALNELPRSATAFAEGLLSWDQLRAVASTATPETDAEWAKRAPSLGAAQLEAVAPPGPPGEPGGRCPSPRRTAPLVARSTAWPSRRGPTGSRGVYELHQVRVADALVEMASTRLATDTDPDRATVVVHVDAAGLGGGVGNAILEDGPPVSADTARRLACDPA